MSAGDIAFWTFAVFLLTFICVCEVQMRRMQARHRKAEEELYEAIRREFEEERHVGPKP